MAAPTITGVTGVPTGPVAPGTPITLTVKVTDPDTRDVTITFTVTDSSGAKSAPSTVTIPLVDGLTAAGVASSGVLTQTGPLTFTYVG